MAWPLEVSTFNWKQDYYYKRTNVLISSFVTYEKNHIITIYTVTTYAVLMDKDFWCWLQEAAQQILKMVAIFVRHILCFSQNYYNSLLCPFKKPYDLQHNSPFTLKFYFDNKSCKEVYLLSKYKYNSNCCNYFKLIQHVSAELVCRIHRSNVLTSHCNRLKLLRTLENLFKTITFWPACNYESWISYNA